MINKALFSSKNMAWETPQWLFDELNEEFHFDLDPCATKETAKCEKFFTEHDDGLSHTWRGHTVFCNPPYGKHIGQWVEKCANESRHAKVVMLIPARTDTRWFHEYIYKNAEMRFLKGRLRFGDSKNSAPFPFMIVIFN